MKKINHKVSLLYTKKREKHRLKRLKRPKLKKRNVQSTWKKRIKVVLPEILDLQENRSQFIDILGQVRKVLLNNENFLIDHRNLKCIEKEALLVLTAEIERCSRISGIKLRGMCKYTPKDSSIRTLLKMIGYWDYFNIDLNDCSGSYHSDKELYLKIVGDTVISGEKIGNLITFFEGLICFDEETRDKFSDAMLEAAANTVEHAYKEKQVIETINKWWLTASLNTSTDEISFIFYDQGLGILNTLETSQRHIKLKRLVLSWIHEGVSKGGILKNLVTTNLSSYKDERRGNGLISFKSFIDQVEDGELTIYTDNVSYSAISDQICNYNSSIDGTLIVWKIKANHHTNKCMYVKGATAREE